MAMESYNPRSGNTPDYVAPKEQTTEEAKRIIAEARMAAKEAAFLTDPSLRKNPLNRAIANNPLNKVIPAPAPQQIGPLLGANAPKFVPVGTIITASGEEIEVDASGKSAAGGTPVGSTKPVSKESTLTSEQKDAYALLKDVFTLYGLEDLVPVIEGYMKNDVGPQQAKVQLRTEPAYIKRFKGNELRAAKGLNVLQEDEYLALENDYDETLNSYGISNYFGASGTKTEKEARRIKQAEVIGNAVSALEFKDRINTVVTRVKNADTATKNAFKQFYNVEDADLIKYFLGGEGSESLKNKVTAAEISGAFSNQGLNTNQVSAESYAAYGITRAGAIQGAADIAEVLPEATRLGNIYGETGIKYTQQTGEEEFLKSSDAAKRKRNVLASKERAIFEGSAGNAPGAYSTSYLRKSSAAGQI
jgi:hypothetical protein